MTVVLFPLIRSCVIAALELSGGITSPGKLWFKSISTDYFLSFKYLVESFIFDDTFYEFTLFFQSFFMYDS